MTDTCDIAVVGAGAAGLAAAIFAGETARGAARIVVLDGAPSVGRKILVSGGGRCNVMNATVTALDYHGARPVVRNVLAAFDAAAARQWFASLGVALKQEEDGKLFPVSDDARTVLAALLRRCDAVGVRVVPRHRVRAVRRGGDRDGFVVEHAGGALRAARVVMATGGCSLPRTGSDGAGWEIVRALGHDVTETSPALVPLVLCRGAFHAGLSGIAQTVELTVCADGKRVDRRAGSLLWTHFGISGPVVLDASRFWVSAHARGQRAELRCSVLPGDDFAAADTRLLAAAAQHPRRSVGRVLAEWLPERVAQALAHAADCEPATPLGRLGRDSRRALARALTELPLPVERDRGWDFAEVTAGGVPLDEIDHRTMESRRVPGLYLVGEMLDCDGRIGGFNFQWAWSTGHAAGRAAGRAVGG